MAELQRLTSIKKRLEGGMVNGHAIGSEGHALASGQGGVVGATERGVSTHATGQLREQPSASTTMPSTANAWGDGGGHGMMAGGGGRYNAKHGAGFDRQSGGMGVEHHGGFSGQGGPYGGFADHGFADHGFADGPPPAPDPSLRAPAPNYQPVTNCDRVDANQVILCVGCWAVCAKQSQQLGIYVYTGIGALTLPVISLPAISLNLPRVHTH